MRTLRVKNWREFQHYKDRKPSWIKLHRELLDDMEFHCLPLASRALAPMLWLLASEYQDGAVPYDTRKIAFRLRCGEQEVVDAIGPLIEAGFLVVDSGESAVSTHSAAETSKALAQPEQPASNTLAQRERREERETEKEREREGAALENAFADATTLGNHLRAKGVKTPPLGSEKLLDPLLPTSPAHVDVAIACARDAGVERPGIKYLAPILAELRAGTHWTQRKPKPRGDHRPREPGPTYREFGADPLQALAGGAA